MTLFLNYDHNTDNLSINTYRIPYGSFGDIKDLVKAVDTRNESVSCPLAGAKEALSDKYFVMDVDAWMYTINMIYNKIEEYEKEYLEE